MKRSNLLVCLSPKVSSNLINELTFYNIVNPHSPVMNVRMVSTEGQIKAFVQVKDPEAAETVIIAINGQKTGLGKIKVFVSHKKFINYEKTLSQILNELGPIKMPIDAVESFKISSIKQNTTSSSHERVLNDNSNVKILQSYKKSIFDSRENQVQTMDDQNHKKPYKNTNSFEEESLKDNHIEKKNLKSNLGEYFITLTSYDPKKFKANFVKNFFDRFGYVTKTEIDNESQLLRISYASEEEMSKAIREIINNHVSDYKIVSYANKLNKNVDYLSKNDESNGYVSENSLYCATSCIKLRNTLISNSLRVFDTTHKLTLKEFCKFISNQHIPLKAFEAFDLRQNCNFFVASFRTCEDAFNSYNYLNENRSPILQFGFGFVDIETHTI